MKTLDAVIRKSKHKVSFSILESTLIYNKEFQFVWYPPEQDTKYLFKSPNLNVKAVFIDQQIDSGHALTIPNVDSQYKIFYKWVVVNLLMSKISKDTVSLEVALLKMENWIKNRIDIEELDDTSLYNNLMIAEYLKSVKLYGDAIYYYLKSFELARNSEFYLCEDLNFFLEVFISTLAIAEWNTSPFCKSLNFD